MKTNNKDNHKMMDDKKDHHKTMTGMEMEMYNNNHITKMAVAHSERDDEHGTEQKAQVVDTFSSRFCILVAWNLL